MLRQVRPTLILLAAGFIWLSSAAPAPAQGFGHAGGKGPAGSRQGLRPAAPTDPDVPN